MIYNINKDVVSMHRNNNNSGGYPGILAVLQSQPRSDQFDMPQALAYINRALAEPGLAADKACLDLLLTNLFQLYPKRFKIRSKLIASNHLAPPSSYAKA